MKDRIKEIKELEYEKSAIVEAYVNRLLGEREYLEETNRIDKEIRRLKSAF